MSDQRGRRSSAAPKNLGIDGNVCGINRLGGSGPLLAGTINEELVMITGLLVYTIAITLLVLQIHFNII